MIRPTFCVMIDSEEDGEHRKSVSSAGQSKPSPM
jgi:hypothetical protein